MNGARLLPLLVPSLLLGGCIEYFAEPPDLGPLPPPLDGGAGDACVMAPEVCDGVDNDCDGEVDEQDPSLCPAPEINAETGQRRCTAGTCVLVCVEGFHDIDDDYQTGCEYACRPNNDGVEQCDARDNDCDGITDEELAPPPADRQAGICAGATRVCVGQWVEPPYGEQAGYEQPEVSCDGRDNDCDGQIDEVSVVRDELCDGRDNNCDGQVDEGLVDCCGSDDRGPPCNGCIGVAMPAAGWVCIPPGEFTMGSPEAEVGRYNDEGPQRRVTLNRPLLMQTTEVTQAAWQAVAGNNPSHYGEAGPDGACDADAPGECPVEDVNWFEAAWYANELSAAEGLLPCYTLDGCNANAAGEDLECEDAQLVDVHCAGYRLPTEAEWEYATRAGTVTRFWSGDAEADLTRVGWYLGNSGLRPHRVAQKAASTWGLYDVHGNVSEWVSDWYGPYGPAELRDPTGPPDGADRVARGGAAWFGAHIARSAQRDRWSPDRQVESVGFRLARPAPSPGLDH